jgi:two-component system NtrC family sensor kinase
MPTLAELEQAVETATTDLAKSQALTALAKELRYTEPQRAKSLVESALALIGESQAYNLEKAKVLLELGWCNVRLSNYEVAMQKSKEALTLFQQANDKNGIAGSLGSIGNIYYLQADYPKALNNYQESLNFRRDIGDKQVIAASLNGIGSIYSAQADYPNALKHLQESLNIRRDIDDKQGIASSLNNIGNIYSDQADYPNALKHYQESLNIRRDIDDKQGIASSLNNIGNIYSAQADYPNALKHLQESLNICRDLGDKRGIALSLCNIGNIYSAQADYPNALKHLQESLNICRDLGDKRGIAWSLVNIGGVYFSLGDYPNALKHTKEGLSISNAIGDKRVVAHSNIQIGITLIKLHQFEEAETHLQQALVLCDELGLKKERYDTLESLAELYAETNQFEKAYLTHIEFHKAKEAVFSEDNQKKLTNLQVRFDTEQAQKEAELHKKDAELTRLKNVELASALKQLQQTQEQLIHAEKMASLGELTAGIAHEIQNPLNFVNNFSDISADLCKELQTELQKLNLPPNDQAYVTDILNDLVANMEKISHHGNRASSIVKGMLQHSRKGTGDKSETDLNVMLTEYLNLAYHGYRAKEKSFNAVLVQELDPTLPKLMVVSQDMSRVFLNIINNAFYSVNDKRKAIGDGYAPEVKIVTKSLATGVEIRIRDNGKGIPEKIREKILQPFFTTKPTGEGTGLGLSLSYDIIVKGHNGELKVETQEGEYAEFVITLPKKLSNV